MKIGSPGIMMPCSNSYCAHFWMAVTSLNIVSIAYAVELFTAGLKAFLAIYIQEATRVSTGSRGFKGLQEIQTCVDIL